MQRNHTETTFAFPSLNINNLVVASFASVLILLTLAFFLGVMYICAKLRNQNSTGAVEVGDSGWVHNSFNRGNNTGSTTAAAATAAMYNYQGAYQEEDGLNSLAMNRPTFYARNDTASRAGTASRPIAGGGGGGGGGAIGSLVPAMLPNISERQLQQPQRCFSMDEDQPYDQLRMQRLALSGPFANETAGSSDSLVRTGNAGLQIECQSEEYLDVLGLKK